MADLDVYGADTAQQASLSWIYAIVRPSTLTEAHELRLSLSVDIQASRCGCRRSRPAPVHGATTARRRRQRRGTSSRRRARCQRATSARSCAERWASRVTAGDIDSRLGHVTVFRRHITAASLAAATAAGFAASPAAHSMHYSQSICTSLYFCIPAFIACLPLWLVAAGYPPAVPRRPVVGDQRCGRPRCAEGPKLLPHHGGAGPWLLH